MRWRALLVLSFAWVDTAAAAPARAGTASFLGPGGILAPGTRAVFLEADTELTGFPTLVVGYRRGVADGLDLGIELGGIDVAFLGRLHAKVRFWEALDHAWYFGLRLRVDFKRHRQDFGAGVFRPLDDFGFAVVPAVSVSRRFGESAAHSVHYTAFYYFDIDIRPGYEVEHYLGPAVIGYEYRFLFGLFLQGDVGLGFELFQPRTAGEPIIKIRAVVGYGF